MKTPQPGNVGVITTTDSEQLHVIDSVDNGLVYCHPLTGNRITKVCLPDHFWVLMDSMP